MATQMAAWTCCGSQPSSLARRFVSFSTKRYAAEVGLSVSYPAARIIHMSTVTP